MMFICFVIMVLRSCRRVRLVNGLCFLSFGFLRFNVLGEALW